jgi:hypothetical protein
MNEQPVVLAHAGGCSKGDAFAVRGYRGQMAPVEVSRPLLESVQAALLLQALQAAAGAR